jgi:hypothetical protein
MSSKPSEIENVPKVSSSETAEDVPNVSHLNNLVTETEQSKHSHKHNVLICNQSVFETLKMFPAPGHVFLFICFKTLAL